ncbi:MAG: hypothetical protein ABI589_12855 [Burkholderiales bacterium]
MHESIGYLASLLVLATFCMRDMAALRLLAIASNAAFIAYGALADVRPVLLLHLVLLPVNLVRLAQAPKPTVGNVVRQAGRFRGRSLRPCTMHDLAIVGGGRRPARTGRLPARTGRLPAKPARTHRGR